MFIKKHKRLTIGLIIFTFVICLAILIVNWVIDSKLDKLDYSSQNENTPMKTGADFKAVDDDYVFKTDGLEEKDSGSDLPADEVFSDSNIINILLLGTDMKLVNTQDPGRCDATMLFSINKTTGDIKLVGFERALGVPIPKYEDEMLNAAFQYGGGEFMQETINKCFLVDIAGFVHVEYEIFANVIDALGGIDVELNLSEVYNISRNLAYLPQADTIHTGLCHLDGVATYSYCRMRESDDDWARQGRLRTVISAIVDKLKTKNVAELNSLLDTVLPMINTNLSKKDIKGLISLSPKLIGGEMSQMMVPDKESAWHYATGGGKYLLGCDYSEWAGKINDFIQEKK